MNGFDKRIKLALKVGTLEEVSYDEDVCSRDGDVPVPDSFRNTLTES